MDPMITAGPMLPRAYLHKRDSSSNNGSSTLNTCGYLSGDFASPLTCGLGYTCSTGPSILPSHLGCCNAVDCAPSSGAHTCITAESGTIPCTGDLSTGCIDEYTSLLFCTNPTAPACITYSQPPPSSGSAASAGFSPTIFSYSCGPTQTTKIFLATATNAPATASATPTSAPVSISNLPIYAYVLIGIGGVLVLLFLIWFFYTPTETTTVYVRNNQPTQPRYRCRHCESVNLWRRIVQPGNHLNNDGRYYYVCTNPLCPNVNRQDAAHHDSGWVTWDDAKGVEPGNPSCRCMRSARMDMAGNRKRFWTCATGNCGYTSWRLDGQETWGPGF